MALDEKIKNELNEASADAFKFKLKKILALNKSQLQRIVDLVNKGNYTNAILSYQNFLQTNEEAAQNFIIGLAAANTLSNSKFGGKK